MKRSNPGRKEALNLRLITWYRDPKMETAVAARKTSKQVTRGDFSFKSRSRLRKKARIAASDNAMSGMSRVVECSGNQKLARYRQTPAPAMVEALARVVKSLSLRILLLPFNRWRYLVVQDRIKKGLF